DQQGREPGRPGRRDGPSPDGHDRPHRVARRRGRLPGRRGGLSERSISGQRRAPRLGPGLPAAWSGRRRASGRPQPGACGAAHGLPARLVETHPWREPLATAAGLSRREGALALLAGAGDPDAHGGRWSFVACEPDQAFVGRVDDGALFQRLRDPAYAGGGVVGLMSYDAGARPATGERGGGWPDLMLARYPALLAFDHRERRVQAVGRGIDAEAARLQVRRAAEWLEAATSVATPSPPCDRAVEEGSGAAYEAA